MSDNKPNMRLTTREAADYTGVRPELLRAAVRRGELLALHPNAKVYLFTKEDLDTWLDSIKRGA
jgi:excisionase family DNA binding protein